MRCFDLLELPTDAEPEEIRTRWRELARTNHPDRGGDVTVFQELSQAYDRALAFATERPCPSCLGLGKVRVVSGFTSVEVACSLCAVTKEVP